MERKNEQSAHKKKPCKPNCPLMLHESGWGDLNSRPPAPEAGALTGLRYTPMFSKQ